ncbi:type II toxin-antitoxin system RelE/ParE family toxin [Candidatus Saganbacteria bacterium]|nr:type II toxin-antitoxin system RelE/ParE family toxin [Candidatus Saganbacteria bacterium]
MASYNVEFKKSALKDLKKIDKSFVAGIFSKVENLAENPRSTQSVKIKGSENSYRLRVGNYRMRPVSNSETSD